MISLSQMLGINTFSGIVAQLGTRLQEGFKWPGIEQEDNLPALSAPLVLIPLGGGRGWEDDARLLIMALYSESYLSYVY